MSLPFISEMSGKADAVRDRGAAEKVMYEFPVVLALSHLDADLAMRANIVNGFVEFFSGHLSAIRLMSRKSSPTISSPDKKNS